MAEILCSSTCLGILHPKVFQCTENKLYFTSPIGRSMSSFVEKTMNGIHSSLLFWSLIIFRGETMRTTTFPYIICILLLLCRINIYFIQSHSANCNYSVHQPKKISRDGEQGFGMWMVQWWECLFPTNVSQIRSPDPVSLWVEFDVGSLLCSKRFFSR